MKSYDERTQNIRAKLSAKRRQRRKSLTAAISMVCCIVLIAGVITTIPAEESPLTSTIPSTEPLGRDYTSLTKALRNIRYKTPTNDVPLLDFAPGADLEGIGPSLGPTDGDTEITDNQVSGVTEADIINRSNEYIFYLHDDALKIYSIAGVDSAEVGSYDLTKTMQCKEMFLSEDYSTITIIGPSRTAKTLYIINLDVTDPLNVKEIGRMALSGQYQSARFTDGSLYLFTSYHVPYNCDLDNPATFLPLYGTEDNMTGLLMDDIVICRDPQYAVYSVVTELDPVTLEMKDTLALLGYGGQLYVSQSNIYLTRSTNITMVIGNTVINQSATEICRIRYIGDKLEVTGCMEIEGTVKDQYSLDEKDGILRVVTTVRGSTGINQSFGDSSVTNITDSYLNASLYCVDFDNGKVIAKAEKFAPDGEQVQSVRFDGDKAYVCTSIQLSDPVFCFDLSDLSNITWVDTGTIDGFSSSLVELGNGFLLGIGRGSSWNTVKIEVYREGQTAMEPYCSYEADNAYISTDYKAYYIDRSNQFVGLGISSFNGHVYSTNYLLLHFDGTQLIQKVMMPLEGEVTEMRGVCIDGWLYMLGEEFKVAPIE